MRFLLTTIILTMLAQPVWAVDMGRMFKYCQTLSAAGFDAGKIEDDVDQATAFACVGYIAGVIDVGRSICGISDDETTRRIWGIGADREQIDAVIQTFVNYARENPQLWSKDPFDDDWAGHSFPCKE